jgi:hypothetical protein
MFFFSFYFSELSSIYVLKYTECNIKFIFTEESQIKNSGGIKIFEALRWGMTPPKKGIHWSQPMWQFISIFKNLRIRSNRINVANSSQAALIRAILGKWEHIGENRRKAA